MLYMTPARSMFMISPINIPIFVSQPLLFPSSCIHYLTTCLHELKCGHKSCPECYVTQMPPYGRPHCVLLNFCGNSGACNNSTMCTVSYTVQCRGFTSYANEIFSKHSFSHSCTLPFVFDICLLYCQHRTEGFIHCP